MFWFCAVGHQLHGSEIMQCHPESIMSGADTSSMSIQYISEPLMDSAQVFTVPFKNPDIFLSINVIDVILLRIFGRFLTTKLFRYEFIFR